MLSIRKYEPKDKEGVRNACLNSEGEGNMSPETCEFVLHIFCDYYTENEPDNCFVLDDDGKAVGYVICAENFDKFKPVYDEKYFPQIVYMGKERIEWANEAYVLQEKYKEQYPAHLHIDLLPQYQRMGWGGKLINTLFDHLRSKGIKGVMLTAGTNNTVGGSFYQKYGFEQLEIYDTDVAYGMKL